jgi:hypothetical protein
MLFDEEFAARVHRGDAAALEGLSEEESRILRAADPVCVAADRQGRRKTQALGNLLKEFLLSASAADEAGLSLGAQFFSSKYFHDAVRDDRRLPLAFADHVEAQSCAWGRPEIRALVTLEAGMVRARRAAPRRFELAPGELVLAPDAALLEVAEGTAEFAAAWRKKLAERGQLQATIPKSGERETLLLRRQPRASHYATPELSVEVLLPNVAPIFHLATTPLGREERRHYAAELGASLEDLDAFLDGFVEEGSLLRAS